MRLENDTLWLSQRLMVELFEKDADTIGLHIRNIFTEGELEQTLQRIRQARETNALQISQWPPNMKGNPTIIQNQTQP